MSDKDTPTKEQLYDRLEKATSPAQLEQLGNEALAIGYSPEGLFMQKLLATKMALEGNDGA